MIREANKFDFPKIIDLLLLFRKETPIEQIAYINNTDYVNKLLTHIVYGNGICYVATFQDEIIGIIAGMIDNVIWDPKTFILRELVWYVEEEYRHTSAGYKLLKAYNDKAKELISENRITMYTMTKMTNSPDFDFGKFGYKKAEEVWVAGV